MHLNKNALFLVTSLVLASSLEARMLGYRTEAWLGAQKTEKSGDRLLDYKLMCTSLGVAGKDIPVDIPTACKRVYDFSKKKCDTGDIKGCQTFISLNLSLSSNLKGGKEEGLAFPDLFVSRKGAYKLMERSCNELGDGFSCGYYAFLTEMDPSYFKTTEKGLEKISTNYLIKSCDKSSDFTPAELDRFRPCEMLFYSLADHHSQKEYNISDTKLKAIKARADEEYDTTRKYLQKLYSEEDPTIWKGTW